MRDTVQLDLVPDNRISNIAEQLNDMRINASSPIESRLCDTPDDDTFLLPQYVERLRREIVTMRDQLKDKDVQR